MVARKVWILRTVRIVWHTPHKVNGRPVTRRLRPKLDHDPYGARPFFYCLLHLTWDRLTHCTPRTGHCAPAHRAPRTDHRLLRRGRIVRRQTESFTPHLHRLCTLRTAHCTRTAHLHCFCSDCWRWRRHCSQTYFHRLWGKEEILSRAEWTRTDQKENGAEPHMLNTLPHPAPRPSLYLFVEDIGEGRSEHPSSADRTLSVVEHRLLHTESAQDMAAINQTRRLHQDVPTSGAHHLARGSERCCMWRASPTHGELSTNWWAPVQCCSGVALG